MTDIITDTTAYVTGSKESLIKLLNRVLRAMGSEKATVSVDDSLESINVKIEQAKESMAKYNAEFTLIDFLDDRNRMNSPYKDYVLSYIDEEEPDGCEDYGVVLSNAQTKGDDYTIQIASHVHEAQGSYSSRDWDDWCERMVRLYGCRIILTMEYADGNSPSSEDFFCGYDAKIFETDGDAVNMTVIGPRYDFTEYFKSLDKLAESIGLDPSTILDYLITDYESIVNKLQLTIDRWKNLRKDDAKAAVEWAKLRAEMYGKEYNEDPDPESAKKSLPNDDNGSWIDEILNDDKDLPF